MATFDVVLPITSMFKDELDMIIQESGSNRKMWLRHIDHPINDWLEANTTAPYQIWKIWLEDRHILSPNIAISFQFESADDAMRFKLTWSGT